MGLMGAEPEPDCGGTVGDGQGHDAVRMAPKKGRVPMVTVAGPVGGIHAISLAFPRELAGRKPAAMLVPVAGR